MTRKARLVLVGVLRISGRAVGAYKEEGGREILIKTQETKYLLSELEPHT